MTGGDRCQWGKRIRRKCSTSYTLWSALCHYTHGDRYLTSGCQSSVQEINSHWAGKKHPCTFSQNALVGEECSPRILQSTAQNPKKHYEDLYQAKPSLLLDLKVLRRIKQGCYLPGERDYKPNILWTGLVRFKSDLMEEEEIMNEAWDLWEWLTVILRLGHRVD